MTARQAMEKISTLDIRGAVEQAIQDTAEQYLDLNRQQMQEGKQRNDDPIQLSPLEWFPGYSPGYKRRREFLGLQTEFVDLDRTHDFQDGFTLEVDGEIINITSEVDYEKWITGRFGKLIWGLSPENIQVYRDESMLPAVRENITSQSGLTFGI